MLRGLITLCGCALLVLSMPSGARAYEDQITVGFGMGYANAISDSLPANGVMFDATASYGLSTTWALRARVSYALHPADSTLNVGIAGAEVLYVVDVLEVVPYFGLGVDAFGAFRSGDSEVDPALHAVAGLDYLVSRAVAVGVDLRLHLLPTELDHDPLYFAALATTTWMFDR